MNYYDLILSYNFYFFNINFIYWIMNNIMNNTYQLFIFIIFYVNCHSFATLAIVTELLVLPLVL